MGSLEFNLAEGDVPEFLILRHLLHRIKNVVNLVPEVAVGKRDIHLTLGPVRLCRGLGIDTRAYHNSNTSADRRGDLVTFLANHGAGELVDGQSRCRIRITGVVLELQAYFVSLLQWGQECTYIFFELSPRLCELTVDARGDLGPSMPVGLNVRGDAKAVF